MNLTPWINSIRRWTQPLAGVAGKIPWRVWIGAVCLGLAWLWLYEHDARLRQAARLDQTQREAAAQVAGLKKQAAANVQAANVENARAIEKLEGRRQELARRDRELTAQLAALRKDEQAQAAQVATLPTSEVVTRVAAQLGLESPDFASVPAIYDRRPAHGGEEAKVRRSQIAGTEARGANAAGAVSSPPEVGAGPRPAPGTVPVAASGGSHGLPDRRPAHGGAEAEVRRSQIAATGGRGDHAAPTGNPMAAAGAPEGSPGAGSLETPVLPLSASGARKVETALLALDACRAQSSLQTQQISNCRERATTDATTIQRQADSLGKLNQALAAQQQILDRQQAACQAELRAARGTFWGRLTRVSKHVAIGVAVGVALGVAVR